MKLIALKSIGRLRPGDEFEVRANEARVLKAIGKAKDAPAPAAKREPARESPHRLSQQPEPIAVAPTPELERPPARTVPRFYRRRDMVSEES